MAPTSVRPSVMKATSAELGETDVNTPTSAAPGPVPASTGELRTMPSLEPLPTRAERRQSVMEREVTSATSAR